MLLAAFAILIGFVALLWGADRFVVGAAATARNLGVSPLVIGLTIVGFGTSAPEMLVSAMAAWAGSGQLSVGNALGSCVTNVALVLGASALVAPLTVHSRIVRRELPLLLGVMVLSGWLLWDGDLSRMDGALLLTTLLGYLGWMARNALAERSARASLADPLQVEFEAEIPEDMSTARALGWLGVGLVTLVFGSRVLVWGAVDVARHLGVPELVVGLSVVALGTSLPEVAASVVAARKGEHDIAVGNVVGSNLFNLAGVLALPGLIAPGRVDPHVVARDVPVMFGVTGLLVFFSHGFGRDSVLRRWHGAVLVLVYAAYVTWLYLHGPG